MTIRRVLARALALLAVAVAGTAAAQGYPNKAIRVIVPYPPGGGTDVIARILQEPLAAELGQPIIIDNRGGAAGNLGTDLAAKATADGYTILFTLSSHTINPKLYDKLPFDVERDFAPITLATLVPQILVANPSLPANNMKELIALARKKPGSLSYGSAGIGASGHLAGELLNSAEGIDIVHVPYKGGAPALADLVAGRIQVMFLSISLSAPQVKQGRIKVLALTGKAHSEKLPGVTTTAEQGFPDVQALLFSSLLAPAGTPDAIIRRMNAEVVKALKTPEVEKRLDDLGAVPSPTSPEQFAAILKRDGEVWGKLIRDKNIRAD